MLEHKVLSFTESTNADNRTNSKSFDAKLNTTLERKELCSRIESEFAANGSLSKTIQEPFVSKENDTIETKLVCVITDSTNLQANVLYTSIIISKLIMMFALQTMIYNPMSK